MVATVPAEERMQSLSIAVSPKQREALEQIATEERRSLSFVLREALDDYLTRRGRLSR